MIGRRAWALLAAVGLLAGAAGVARASGSAGTVPWYLDPYGGEPADLKALYGGRLGIVMARAPRPQLYIAWRLLHGQRVGQAAGEALSQPCCDTPPRAVRYSDSAPTGARAWLDTRKLVKGAPVRDYAPSATESPFFMWSETCFDDAFANAATTLKARIARHGAGSPWVQAWLDAQDAVFATCRRETALPPLPAGAPGWLRADRAYQEAAWALYTGRTVDAAGRFASIGLDRTSPWQPTGLYLKARTLRRAALREPTPRNFSLARAAIGDLAQRPAGTYGRGEVTPMLRSLDFRERPAALMTELVAELSRPEALPSVAVSFRDVVQLTARGQPAPEMLDWMNAMRAEVDDRNAALARAEARWKAGRGTAWLIAAMSLTDPGAPAAARLVAAADMVRAGDPGWLSVQFHRTRLTLRTAPAAESRTRLDAILARTDLSASDRNIFTAQRLQVAAGAAEFVTFALRRRLCATPAYDNENGCPRSEWLSDHYARGGVYDGIGDQGTKGLGEDARAVIDRLPLRERIVLSRDKRLAAPLRLDIAITSYARAVLLQDHASADGLARDLAVLLPQMAADWRRIPATPAGPGKRFAEFFILAKIPGVRPDLVDYTRPEGSVASFQRYWIDWILVPKDRAAKPEPPALRLYQSDGFGVYYDDTFPDHRTDLTCLGACGVGAAPLRLPDFAAAAQGRALAERGYILRREVDYGGAEKQPALPPGAVAVWDEMLAFARANPKHAQVPEALYWINRAARWGGSHDHSGRRAFQLLHARYPETTWAKRSPYYYD